MYVGWKLKPWPWCGAEDDKVMNLRFVFPFKPTHSWVQLPFLNEILKMLFEEFRPISEKLILDHLIFTPDFFPLKMTSVIANSFAFWIAEMLQFANTISSSFAICYIDFFLSINKTIFFDSVLLLFQKISAFLICYGIYSLVSIHLFDGVFGSYPDSIPDRSSVLMLWINEEKRYDEPLATEIVEGNAENLKSRGSWLLDISIVFVGWQTIDIKQLWFIDELTETCIAGRGGVGYDMFQIWHMMLEWNKKQCIGVLAEKIVDAVDRNSILLQCSHCDS